MRPPYRSRGFLRSYSACLLPWRLRWPRLTTARWQYSVSQRTNEIGIRMALGARQSDVLKMVVCQGMKLAAAGALIGLAGSLLLGQFLASMLYRVTPRDPLTFVFVSIGLFGVSLVANYIPARPRCESTPWSRCATSNAWLGKRVCVMARRRE